MYVHKTSVRVYACVFLKVWSGYIFRWFSHCLCVCWCGTRSRCLGVYNVGVCLSVCLSVWMACVLLAWLITWLSKQVSGQYEVCWCNICRDLFGDSHIVGDARWILYYQEHIQTNTHLHRYPLTSWNHQHKASVYLSRRDFLLKT